jgi:tRNA dimethylallyltransferase
VSITLLVIAGPTATGKTAAAVRLAQRHDGEIVSADSMQIYRGFDVGTAKPTAEERAQARFHLVDCADPRQPYTVADFQRDARAAIADIQARGRLPILCGGTGLYLRAVLGGLSFPPGGTAETLAIRRRLEAEAETLGAAALHGRLAQVDPATAARVAPADRKRVIRALEVYEATGQPLTALARVDDDAKVNYNAATFALTSPRPLLYARIEARVDEMLAAGWVEEVAGLRAAGFSGAHQAMQAIGYRHLLAYLERGGDWVQVVADIKRDTRRYAKRQLTWFRQDRMTWLEWSTPTDFDAAVETMAQTLPGAGEL